MTSRSRATLACLDACDPHRHPGGCVGGARPRSRPPTPHHLPSLALGNREVLWAERTLVFFYGFLLFLVPILKALGGELPIELSTRGARYAEASDTALEELKARIDENEELLDDTIESLDTIATRLQEESELDSGR